MSSATTISLEERDREALTIILTILTAEILDGSWQKRHPGVNPRVVEKIRRSAEAVLKELKPEQREP